MHQANVEYQTLEDQELGEVGTSTSIETEAQVVPDYNAFYAFWRAVVWKYRYCEISTVIVILLVSTSSSVRSAFSSS